MPFLKLKSPGFNYKFNALSGDPGKNELMKAFSSIFKGGQKPSVISALKAMYPALRFLVSICIITSPFHHLIYSELQPAPNETERKKAAAVMNRIGTGLLMQSRSDKSSSLRKDILSILAQANTMEEKAHQMKDEASMKM